MSDPLNAEYQSMAANAICHAATMAGEVWQQAAYTHMRPSVLYRPALSIDGNQWCALYGESIANGCAGFGVTPEQAMIDFDEKWQQQIPR
jgi:hypothetical protein